MASILMYMVMLGRPLYIALAAREWAASGSSPGYFPLYSIKSTLVIVQAQPHNDDAVETYIL